MSRRSYRSRRNGWSVGLVAGICLAVLAIAGIAAGGITLWLQAMSKTEYDAATGCPKDKNRPAPVNQTVVLIDETDVLSPHQRDYLKTHLTNYVNTDLQPGELLSIYTIGAQQPFNRRPIFEMCKTRDGSDADPLTENQKVLYRKFTKFFQGPLMTKIDSLLEARETASQSPIFEVIQAISVNAFDKWNVSGERRLMIYSDMLQNTAGYSLYRTNAEFKDLKNAPYYADVRTFMPNVEVSLYVFSSQPRFQKNRLQYFWQEYFRDSGAHVTSVMPVGR